MTVSPDAWLELIQARRSVRKFLDRPIADFDLMCILEAARWAPCRCSARSSAFYSTAASGDGTVGKRHPPSAVASKAPYLGATRPRTGPVPRATRAARRNSAGPSLPCPP